MKLEHVIHSSRRKPYHFVKKSPLLAAVCALGVLLGSSRSASALIGDTLLPSLMPAVVPGVAELSLSTGLEIPAANAPAISLAAYPRAGWQATLSTNAHGVRGTVTIVDADTFRVDNFFYDGGGINVHFILAASNNNPAFTAGLIADSLPAPGFLGQVHTGDSVTVDLPAGQTLDGYNAVSLWCIPARANFGSGTFAVPEPVSAGLLALDTVTLVGLSRRRPRRAAE